MHGGGGGEIRHVAHDVNLIHPPPPPKKSCNLHQKKKTQENTRKHTLKTFYPLTSGCSTCCCMMAATGITLTKNRAPTPFERTRKETKMVQHIPHLDCIRNAPPFLLNAAALQQRGLPIDWCSVAKKEGDFKTPHWRFVGTRTDAHTTPQHPQPKTCSCFLFYVLGIELSNFRRRRVCCSDFTALGMSPNKGDASQLVRREQTRRSYSKRWHTSPPSLLCRRHQDPSFLGKPFLLFVFIVAVSDRTKSKEDAAAWLSRCPQSAGYKTRCVEL